MQIGIPKLKHSLLLEPALIDEQTIYHTSTIILASGFFRSFNHGMSDDSAMRDSDQAFFKLAGDAFFNQVAQAESDFCYFGGGDGGGNAFVLECWKEVAGFFAPKMAVCATDIVSEALIFLT